jgi:hypothetical protein
MKDLEATHEAEILDQFACPSRTFSSVAARTSEDSLRLLGEAIGIGGEDEVLDVTCARDCQLPSAIGILAPS